MSLIGTVFRCILRLEAVLNDSARRAVSRVGTFVIDRFLNHTELWMLRSLLVYLIVMLSDWIEPIVNTHWIGYPICCKAYDPWWNSLVDCLWRNVRSVLWLQRSDSKQQIQNKFKFKSIVLISPRHLIIHLVYLIPLWSNIAPVL